MQAYRPNVYFEVKNVLNPILPKTVCFTRDEVEEIAGLYQLHLFTNSNEENRLHLIDFGRRSMSVTGEAIWIMDGHAWIVVDQPIQADYSPVMKREDVPKEGIEDIVCWPSFSQNKADFGYSSWSINLLNALDELSKTKEISIRLTQPLSLRGSFGAHGSLQPSLYLTRSRCQN